MSAVKAFAEREGLVSARGAIQKSLVAPLLGLDEKTLHQFLSNKKRPQPALTTLQRCAAAMGIDVATLVSATKPGPISQDEWDSMDDIHRQAMDALFQIARTTNPEDLPIMVEMLRKAQEIGKARHGEKPIRIN